MLRLCLAVLLLTPVAFGQINTTSSSVTTTASLGQNVAPDQVTFTVNFESGVTASFDDVIGALKGTGITASNFVGMNSRNQSYNGTSSGPVMVLDWFFQIPVPLSGIKSEIGVLDALKASLVQARSPLKLTYSVAGSGSSTQALVQSCSLSELAKAARSQAKDLAAAANLKLEKISALTTSVSTQIGPTAPTPYIVPACNLTITFGAGQTVPNTITISAVRNVNAVPDQAVIAVYVDTSVNGTLNDALAALSGAGVTADNFTSVGTGYSQPGLEWQFSVQVPLSKLKDAIAAFQKAPGGVSFSVQSTQMSAELVASQDCTKTALVADAQAYARRVAAAAGVSLNGIVTISDSTGGGGAYAYLAVFDPMLSGSVVSVSTYLSRPQPSCSVTVQFGIGQ